jgi:hypothetical protein
VDVPVWRKPQPTGKGRQGRRRGDRRDQHPDRARLFLQWKQISWPTLADSLDLLNLETVRSRSRWRCGIVRFTGCRCRPRTIEQTFVNQTYEADRARRLTRPTCRC